MIDSTYGSAPKPTHLCEPKSPVHSGTGPAVLSCYGDDKGNLWVQGTNLSNIANFCPFCGFKAPLQVKFDG